MKDLMKSNDNHKLISTQSHDSNYYLSSPWVTERVGWYFIKLPEKWTENTNEINRSKLKYSEISKETHMYELKLKDLFLSYMFMDAKDGIYENWNLNKSAEATINQVLYNLGCKDIILEQSEPFNNPLEVNYLAKSSCSPFKYKAIIKGIRYESYISLTSIYYKEADPNLEIIAAKIIESIENKYPDVSNAKN
jgi:hypothetical protein